MKNDDIIFCRASKDEELHQILELQKQNLPDSLSDLEKEKEGFLTVVHNFDILKKMNDCCPHIISKQNNKVIGYTLCMHPKFANEIEVLKPLFIEIKKITSAPSQYIVMGQVCVDKAFRNKGIFRGLYGHMKQELQSDFNAIITEVDAKNVRSLNAHVAVGFEIIKAYNFDYREWHIVSLKTT